MKPGIFDFTIYQGSDFDCTIQWLSNNTPVDLTGCALRMQIRESAKSPIVILSLTTENGLLSIVPGDQGFIKITVSAELSRTLDFKTAVYDLEINFSGGKITRFLQGTVTLSQEVTR